MKTFFLTGISRGIGNEIFKLLSDSYYFIGTTRNKIRFYEKHSELVSKNSLKILEIDLDNNPKEAWSDYLERINKEMNSIDSNIDIFVSNMGVAHFAPLIEVKGDTVKSEYYVNSIAPTIIIKSVVSKMVKQKSGLIINISSIATKKTFENASIYSASKNAIIGLTNSLREEVRKHNIKVVNVFLGATNTEIWDEKTREEKQHLMISPENVAKIIQYIIRMSEFDDLMIEDITIRPQYGDL